MSVVRRSTVAVVAMLGVVAACVVSAPEVVSAGQPTDVVTLVPAVPVPFEPFALQVEALDCELNEPATVRLWIEQSATDTVWPEVVAEVAGTTSETGTLSMSVPLPVAYPGRWTIDLEAPCYDVTGGLAFEVALPADFALSAAQDSIQFDRPFSFGVEGTGCTAGHVDWEVEAGMHPVDARRLSTGTVAPDGAGAWAALAQGELRSEVPWAYPVETVRVQATCVSESGITVHYPSVALRVDPVPTTTTTTEPVDPGTVTPRFTG